VSGLPDIDVENWKRSTHHNCTITSHIRTPAKPVPSPALRRYDPGTPASCSTTDLVRVYRFCGGNLVTEPQLGQLNEWFWEVKCYASFLSLLPLSCLSLASLLPLSCLSLASLLPLSCLSIAYLLPFSCLKSDSWTSSSGKWHRRSFYQTLHVPHSPNPHVYRDPHACKCQFRYCQLCPRIPGRNSLLFPVATHAYLGTALAALHLASAFRHTKFKITQHNR
jgi:hypothetical protein